MPTDVISDAEAKIAELHKTIAEHKAATSAREEWGHMLKELGSLDDATTITVRFQNPRTGKDRHFILPHDAAEVLTGFAEKQAAALDKSTEKPPKDKHV